MHLNSIKMALVRRENELKGTGQEVRRILGAIELIC